MTLIDEIIVTDPAGTTRYQEDTDYEVDYDNNLIRRIPGGAIPDGGDVRVFYGKEILSSLIDELSSNRAALLPRVKAYITKSDSPSPYPPEGSDITQDIVACDIELGIAEPGRFRIAFADTSAYKSYDPADDIFIHINTGLATADEYIYQPIMFGVVEERRIIEEKNAHCCVITGHDLSALLDFPRANASALSFNPSYRREVFLNGVLISEDWRIERILSGGEALKVDDIVEIAYRRDFPMCHDIIRELLKEAGWDPANLALNIIDFPVINFDARGKSPLQAIRELASRVGAGVRCDGVTLIISGKEPADDVRTSWTYPTSTILSFDEENSDGLGYTAVQILGHSETGLAPTRANLLPPIDPSMPGYVRLLEKEGTLTPEEPIRTDDPPQPFELSFRLPAGTFDPNTVLVSGARLKETPQRIGDEYEITLLIDWLYEDTAGEPPFIEDEFGNRLFFLRGVVYDAIPDSNGNYDPIQFAKVVRERLDETVEDAEQTADEAGRYIFENVPRGIYKLIAYHPDYLNNYEDNDPLNDVRRDLFEEEAAYDEALENGRFIKLETDYHIIVWARLSLDAMRLREHVVDQLRLEIRSGSTLTGTPLKYAPVIRDENITTETLAAEIGRLIIESSDDANHPRRIGLPMNPFIRPGDSLRFSGSEIDEETSSLKLAIDYISHHLDPTTAQFTTTAYTGRYNPSRLCLRHLHDDPLDQLNGVVVGISRDSQGIERIDVAAAGTVFRSLARSPIVPPVKIGDSVMIAKPSRAAVNYLVVARTADIFGPERIIYV